MRAPDKESSPRKSTELPSYSLDDEEVQPGWHRWIRGQRLAVVLSLALLAAIAVFGAKPLYREAKARRALSIASEAGEAIDRGDAAEATRLLRQAALMAFDDKRVAAIVTLHAARTGDPASITELGRTFSGGKATSEEILVLGEMSLAMRRVDDAARAAGALAPELSPEEASRAAALRAGILHARQRPAEAKDLLREAISRAPGESSDRLRIMLATLLMAERNQTASAEAEHLLEHAAGNRNAQGAAALRLLCANRAGLTPEARNSFEHTAERLRSHPSSTDEDEIFIARLAVSADPSRADELAQSLVARLHKERVNIDTRVAGARLLISVNRFNEVLDLVSDEDASTHAGALMARLDALSGLEDWDRTSQLIEKNRGTTLPDTLYHLFRARVALVRGDEPGAEEEKRILRQVMAFAEPPHVLFAARYAESVGWKPEALAAWRILAANEDARPDALRAQLRNLPPDSPASEGLSITTELLKIAPDDPSVRLSAAYFHLLSGQEIESSAAVAEEFLSADPESADVRRVTALGRLRTGNAAKGLAIWPGDGGENRWKALHAALLRDSGKKKDAAAVEREVDRESLGPEEVNLLSEHTETSAGADRH